MAKIKEGPNSRKSPRKACVLRGVQCRNWRIHQHVRCSRLPKMNASIMRLTKAFKKRRKHSPEIRIPDIAPVAKQRQGQTKSLNCAMKGVLPRSGRSRRPWQHNIQFWMLRKMRCIFWFFRSKRGTKASRQAFPSPSVPPHTLTGGVSTGCLPTSETFHNRNEFWTDVEVHGRSEERLVKGSSKQTLDKKLGPSEQRATSAPDLLTSKDTDTVIITKKTTERTISAPSQDEVTDSILEFLCDFYQKYGSFIPLRKKEVLRHLKEKLNTVYRYASVLVLIEKCKSAIVGSAMPAIRVVYNKHTLTLDDLATLENENWLNDQVMNMYGELIMESAQHKVHFFNSFFHRQLMTKGYEGVRRWTKKVDLFSKSLILIPIHLEVHWCLVTADPCNKRIQLYDSQGIVLKEAAENILKYVMSEAKERKQTTFQTGWEVSVNEEIPQQTNENDCGVFVLEYCRRLGLGKPLHFLQEDMPQVRKRIYKELCHCKLKL